MCERQGTQGWKRAGTDEKKESKKKQMMGVCRGGTHTPHWGERRDGEKSVVVGEGVGKGTRKQVMVGVCVVWDGETRWERECGVGVGCVWCGVGQKRKQLLRKGEDV